VIAESLAPAGRGVPSKSAVRGGDLKRRSVLYRLTVSLLLQY